MHLHAEMKLLIRARIELPGGLEVATYGFREGWSFIRSADAGRLEQKMRKRGWNFIKTDNWSLGSGVGDTSPEAIACALKLALRHVSDNLNVVEVQQVKLTRYPWFFLARVKVSPYRIQQGPELTAPDEVASLPIALQRARVTNRSAALDPGFASVMPTLKAFGRTIC